MNRAGIYIVLILICALVGCSRSGQTEEATPEPEASSVPVQTEETAPPAEEVEIAIPAVCIREGSAFFNTPGADYIAPLSGGEKVTFLGEKKISVVEGREDWIYALVRRSDGSEGWTLTDYLVEEAVPGVILKEAALYSLPSAANLLPNEKVDARQIVGVITEKQHESYYAVRWNVPDTYIVKEQYVRTAYVSTADEDIAVARLVHIALRESDISSRIEQLRTIQSEFPDSRFISDVERKLNELLAGSNEGD